MARQHATYPLAGPVSLTGDVSRLTEKTGVVVSTMAAMVSSYDDPDTSFPLTLRMTSPMNSEECLKSERVSVRE
jgi:hypothetical protein